ncbi:VOC family protein [Haliangium sp.]|uniref:VOC family protein n=1 Tax=Haliangium sp. TaxID=2663208 RepID=UPI003D0D38C9
MKTSAIVPCLWLDDQAERLAAFYTELFPHGRITAVSRYPTSFDNPGGKPRGSVLTVEFEIAGQRFTALNGGTQFTINPTISFFVRVDAAEEAERLFTSLAEGGKVMMPLDAYPWSERYAWVQDRFGVSWQVITTPREPNDAVIAPCMMFNGAQHGRAEEAIKLYTGIFAQGRIDAIERYAEGEGPEGTIKHGRFAIAGQAMVAMDSHIDHGVSFSEAVSLQVMCADQAELDRHWDALSQGGEQGPCGWLKDRFGVSWQVVPADIVTWMASDDVAAHERFFQAIWEMNKLDIAALRTVFSGG